MPDSNQNQSDILILAEKLIQALDTDSQLSDKEEAALTRLEFVIESKLFLQDSRESPDEFLLERFQDRLVEFEQEHPSLAGLVRRISNSLSNMGV
ncbi:DUF4404 domain-containing protein [Kangiella profundi]|uniref:DUF4404 domain-containing protein n=1 Tax=Kangiella profundi TaxID=1561924 RepID=A0A2K9AJ50_9GAMM|nr:DUF4404 family protein [Kangiella profundi]AUD78964.1 DUF4404 domain-containing protein [Kangiella profundi]MBD3667866.1 DUF4404 family protein [Kangiella sp.]GGF02639.1 hypothetical protein GCM10011356_15420 [Kangiella profundi]